MKEDEEVQILYTKNTKKGTQRLLHPVVVKEDKEEDVAVGTTASGTKEENKIESTKKKKTQKSIVSFFNSAPKKTEFVTIGDGSISIQLRELFRDGVMTEEQRGLEEAQLAKNYLSQISEMVKNNFQHRSQKKRLTILNDSVKRRKVDTRNVSAQQSSARLRLPPVPDSSINDINTMSTYLFGFFRCYIEDFMLLQTNEVVVILMPQNHNNNGLFDNEMHCDRVQFGSTIFNMYQCIVTSNPYFDKVVTPMDTVDVRHGLGRGKYGLYVRLHDSNTKDDKSPCFKKVKVRQ